MRRLTACLTLCLLTSLLLAACSRQVVQAPNPTGLDADQYDAYFDSAIQVLRDNGFVIDRRDYRYGTITTRPQGSPNLVEIWNPQNTTADQAVESTLASEQRRVSITFLQEDAADNTGIDDAADGPYAVEVQVILERKQIPTRRLAGSARRNIFSNLAAPPREQIDRGITGSYWEPVGRDAYLEARLLKQISERAGQQE